MTGILYGIGTGPGDPELMTLKAIRRVKESDMIAVPISNRQITDKPIVLEGEKWDRSLLDSCVAYQITLPNVPEINEKPILLCPMPMCKDKKELKAIHDESARVIANLLKQGKNIGFLTLGDPTVYSTYLYIHKRIVSFGLKAEIISGIPSFCAVAAKHNIGLVENKEQLHILPSSYDVVEGLKLSGTKVLMKAGRKMPEIKKKIQAERLAFYMVENCGMPEENVYTEIDQVPEETSYYSLIVLKEEK